MSSGLFKKYTLVDSETYGRMKQKRDRKTDLPDLSTPVDLLDAEKENVHIVNNLNSDESIYDKMLKHAQHTERFVEALRKFRSPQEEMLKQLSRIGDMAASFSQGKNKKRNGDRETRGRQRDDEREFGERQRVARSPSIRRTSKSPERALSYDRPPRKQLGSSSSKKSSRIPRMVAKKFNPVGSPPLTRYRRHKDGRKSLPIPQPLQGPWQK